MTNRRQVLQLIGAAGAGLMLPLRFAPSTGAASVLAAIRGGTLDPTTIPKYSSTLVIPPAMPHALQGSPVADMYKIAVRQFTQQILPSGFPSTTVWSYGSKDHPDTFNYPSFTIEATYDRPVRVTWNNDLVDRSGNFLPHLLPVDQTLHWANPPGGRSGRDRRPTLKTTPPPYTGPVPIVTHVHGAHTYDWSDGFAEAWYLPGAANIPPGYATDGTYFDIFRKASPLGDAWGPGKAVFEYPNHQRATTLWYHDHTLGMTRANVYAGPAGFYLIRGGPHDLQVGTLPGPAPKLGDAPGTRYYEIPIAIQDRSFNTDGSLFYPNSREFFDGIAGPYIPYTDVSPIWNPEFFGNTMVVNGRTWPTLTVEPRRYRFRFLNGCNARFLILKLSTSATARPAVAALPFWQIGTEGGFLPAPLQLQQLLMSPAERTDVIVDFSGLAAGTTLYLVNEGPDEPFGGGESGTDFDSADPATTGQVMRFVVGTLNGSDTSVAPAALTLPTLPQLPGATTTRKLSLNEMMSTYFDGPAAAMLGQVNPTGTSGIPQAWSDPISETPALGATELWEIHNFTEDAHPIHVHLVMFQVQNRQPLGGPSRAPESWETGYKDTVIAYPGEITRIKARFDMAGLYVWHCHIVEHEDNEMMRPYRVG